MRIGLHSVKSMKARLASTSQKDADMDLKKELLDLAKSIQYADDYELTEVPQLLKRASEKIGQLEWENIHLLERLERTNQVYQEDMQAYSINKVELYPISDRPNLKAQLDRLGVDYSAKDNTQRLRRKLQRTLRG